MNVENILNNDEIETALKNPPIEAEEKALGDFMMPFITQVLRDGSLLVALSDMREGMTGSPALAYGYLKERGEYWYIAYTSQMELKSDSISNYETISWRALLQTVVEDMKVKFLSS